MRDNSGGGKGENTMRDPTTRDREGENRPANTEGRDFTERSAFNIGDNARDPDEERSPGDRKRGETASSDRTPAVDR